MISHIKTGNTITLIIKGESKPRVLQVNKRTPEILEKIHKVNEAYGSNAKNKESILEEFMVFIAPVKYVVYKDDRFLLSDDGRLYLKQYPNRPIFGYLSKAIMDFIEENLPVNYLINFWEKCMQNPREEAVNELFQFLESNKIPITPEGNFIAYKKVTKTKNAKSDDSKFTGLKLDKQGNVRDTKGHFVGNPLRQEYIDYLENTIEAQFVDSHTRSIKQSIGDVISMDRGLCDPSRENHCSTGFHYAGYEYAKNFSGNAFIYVEVNPKDVTAIPNDYNYQKGRCCEYKIIGFAEEDELEIKIFE